MALSFELRQVVHYLAAEEGCAIFQGWLIDDYLGTLRLDTLHDALDSTLAEVVAVRLHRQAIHTYHTGVLLAGIIAVVIGIAIVPRFFQYRIGDIVLSRAIALHNRLNQVLRHIGVVRQELFGVLRQTVATIAEAWVVIVCADTWIQAHTLDDCLRVQALHLGIGVQLVEVAHSQCQIRIGEEFHCLCLGQTHEQRVDVLLDGSLLQ